MTPTSMGAAEDGLHSAGGSGVPAGGGAEVYVLWSWLAGIAIEGWTSLMLVVLLLNSAQLIVIGIMGEYLGRTYLETKRRPLYVVQSVVRDAGNETAPSRAAPADAPGTRA